MNRWLLLFLLLPTKIYSQEIFWIEDFGTGCDSGFMTMNYLSANGSWASQNTGTNGTQAGIWYVSAKENGQILGECSSGCGNNRTLHLGGGPSAGDQGAIGFGQQYYGCGPANCATTSKRIVSPWIDCAIYSDIEIRFNYLRSTINQVGGLGAYYQENGNWILMPAISNSGSCETGSLWLEYVFQLPASMNYRTDVQFSFLISNSYTGLTSSTVAIDNIRISGIPLEDVYPPDLVCPGSVAVELQESICHPTFSAGCGDDIIDQVKIYNSTGDTLMNTGQTGCNGTPSSHIEYSPIAGITTCSLQSGSQYFVYFSSYAWLPQFFGMWIDYNNDGDFDDSGEFVWRSLQANTQSNFSFIVTAVPPGVYRMRVIADYSYPLLANQSCINATWGEGSDFLINIEMPIVSSICNQVPDYSNWGGVYDLHDNDVSIEQVPAAGTIITEDIEVILTATDYTGNSAQCSFVIPYLETGVPILNCPQNISQPISPVAFEGFVEIPLPVVSPTCSPLIITNDVNDNSSATGIFPAGISIVNYIATAGEFSSTCAVQIELIPTCCTGDFDCDGSIAVSDLILLMNDFGCLNTCDTDINSDGLVNVYDVQLFMGLLQPTCP